MEKMTIKTKFALIAITLALSSCAAKIPESTLNEYAQNYTAIILCGSHVSEYKINQTRELLTNNLRSWAYDSDLLDKKIKEYYHGYDLTKVTGEVCNSYIDAVYSNLVVDYNNRVEQERVIMQNMNATAQIIGQFGSSVNSYGSSALATVQSGSALPASPMLIEQKNNMFYEGNPNPMNGVSGQTLTGTDVSSTGKKVCIYSAGATKVLPYGSVVCPQIYSE